MKINESGRIGAIHSYQKQSEQRAQAANHKKQIDQVKISPEAKELQSTQQAHSAGRAEKVSDLKQQVQTGTYHVEAGKIAEKLLPYLKQ
ncbi:flagellar biosynthesis anti-sigma factor FlgM [Paenibacillus sp. GCM10023252]|uniref:flagellar biosynthesis anti-sigma factor FlgM n=1 Tax=Paenibacillus sp. GCM10023252 TaxID=3252649 RepID=UPI0036123C1E